MPLFVGLDVCSFWQNKNYSSTDREVCLNSTLFFEKLSFLLVFFFFCVDLNEKNIDNC